MHPKGSSHTAQRSSHMSQLTPDTAEQMNVNTFKRKKRDALWAAHPQARACALGLSAPCPSAAHPCAVHGLENLM